MRNMMAFFLITATVLLSGCKGRPAAQPTTQPTAQTVSATQPETRPELPGLRPTRPDAGELLSLGEGGAVRRSYGVAVNSVRYVTAASQLPRDEAFVKYDPAYFETGALLLVTETLNSGSGRVSIQSVAVEDGVARVKLLHEPTGDMGLPAMTTWLIWAEVEPGLDYQWVLENPALDSDVKKE